MNDYLRAFISGVMGAVVMGAIVLLDEPMLGRQIHYGWSLGVGFVAIFVFMAVSLVIWRNEG